MRDSQLIIMSNNKVKANSKTFVYSSFLALKFCTNTSREPRGSAANESTNEPEKAREHIDDEQSPPRSTVCQPWYNGGLRIRKSRDADAEETEILSWITYHRWRRAYIISRSMFCIRTFQYKLCASRSLPRSRLLPCWMNFRLEVLVPASPNEINITLGR